MSLTPTEQASLCTSLENTLEEYLYTLTHHLPLRHGAFTASITPFTNPSTSLSILHHSSLLSPTERDAVARVKHCHALFRDGEQIPRRYAKKPKQLVERMASVFEDTVRSEKTSAKPKSTPKKNVLVIRGGGSDQRHITRTILYTRRPPPTKPKKKTPIPALFSLENVKKPPSPAKPGTESTKTKIQPPPSSNLFTYATSASGETTIGTRKSKQATKNAKEKERRKRKKAKLIHHLHEEEDDDDV